MGSMQRMEPLRRRLRSKPVFVRHVVQFADASTSLAKREGVHTSEVAGLTRIFSRDLPFRFAPNEDLSAIFQVKECH